MENVEESIGVDVSKKTLDVYLHQKQQHKQFSNDQAGFKRIMSWVKSKGVTKEHSVFCFEHTGWYCIHLSYFLNIRKLRYCCVNPMEIKRSMGLKRGKTDKADSKEIARYAWLHREELVSSVPPPEKLIDLQRMMSFREQLAKQLRALKCLIKGMDVITDQKGAVDISQDMLKETINHLESQMKRLEKEMLEIIKTDSDMLKHYKLSKSVKGVGLVLAIQMLVHTHNYSRFASWRQFSCYCGLVPFPHQSGTSINGRMRIHPISDRKMKSLLSMSAISAIQHDAELKQYYEKRVREGKPKMVVLNIIRNKLVSRIFATVNRGTPYQEIGKLVA